MRILVPVGMLLTLLGAAQCGAASGQPTASIARAANELMREGGTPVLFVGRVVDVDSSNCAKTGFRHVRYSAGKVLFGFVPDQVNVGYRNCKGSKSRFSPDRDLVVLALCSGSGSGISREELVLRATLANIKWARSFLDDDLKKKIARFMRNDRPPHEDRVVVFQGTLREPVPKVPEPAVCTVIPIIQTKYYAEEVIYGDLANQQVVVKFGYCGNLPAPPFSVGQRMIVIAQVAQSSEVYGDRMLVVAPQQIAPVKAALHLK